MNIKKAKRSILNKWDWENSDLSVQIFVHGSIGIGKTHLVNEIVAERKLYELEKLRANNTITEEQLSQIDRLKNYKELYEIQDIIDEHLVVIRCSQRPIEFFTGVPAPDFNNKSATFLMPDCLTQFKSTDWCVVFLDELDKSDPAKFAAITYLIESRRIGELILPKDTYVIAALNRVNDSWLSRNLPPELCNRGSHIEIEPDLTEWLNWAYTHNIRHDIINFLKFKKSLNENCLAVYDNTGSEEDYVKAFPTPRTWHLASRQLDKLQKRGCTFQEMVEEMGQIIGQKMTTEFSAYVKLYQQVDVEAILNGNQKIPTARHGDNRAISQQYIYVFAICNYLQVDHIKDDKRMINLMNALNSLLDDLKIAFLMTISATKPQVNNFIHSSPHGESLIDWFLEKVSSI